MSVAVVAPERVRALVRALAHARHAVIQDAGHLAPMEQPEIIRALLLAFLR